MKPLHLICNDKKENVSNAYAHYFYVINKYVYACDGNCLIKMPTSLVFDDVEFSESDYFAFSGKQWESAKFHTSKKIRRVGNTFINESNNECSIKPLAHSEISWNVPDFDSVLPAPENSPVPTHHIGFNPEIFFTLAKCFGTKDFDSFTLQFYGLRKSIEVFHADFPDVSCILMPCVIVCDRLKELPTTEG